MNQRVEQYQRRLHAALVVLLVLFGVSGWAVWWLLSTVLTWPNHLSLLAGAGFVIAAGLIAARALADLITKPVKDIAAAVSHVSHEASSLPAPDIRNQALAGDLAKTLAEQIYRVATIGAELGEKLQSKQDFMQELFFELPVAVWSFSDTDTLLFMNSTAEIKLGHGAKELAGAHRSKVMDWVFRTDETFDVWLEQVRQQAVKADKFWERVSLISKDGERLIGDVSAHYEKHEPGGSETVVVFIDRTSEYTADEAELDFVAVAAHELRGPITVIRGYLDVFKQEVAANLSVEQQTLLQKMTVSAEMLSLYINNILNVARVEQQDMKLHLVKADWLEIMNQAYADLFLRAKTRGRLLKLELPPNLPNVAVDSVSITEVINNLVDNAIKYSPEGGEIIIRVKQVEGLIETTVEDFGVGIPEAVVGNLFKKFYRSHRTRQGVSGTGLGLYLSRSIVEAHGGNIWVRSKEGQGTIFGFDLPTYDSIADTLKSGQKDGAGIKRSSHGWIKNHTMYRR